MLFQFIFNFSFQIYILEKYSSVYVCLYFSLHLQSFHVVIHKFTSLVLTEVFQQCYHMCTPHSMSILLGTDTQFAFSTLLPEICRFLRNLQSIYKGSNCQPQNLLIISLNTAKMFSRMLQERVSYTGFHHHLLYMRISLVFKDKFIFIYLSIIIVFTNLVDIKLFYNVIF